MTIEDAKRQIILRLDALSEEQYEAVKKCITQRGGLLLTEGMDEKYQIRHELTDALELLWEECQKGGADFEKMVRAWQGGDWETTIACLMLQGRFEDIKKFADSI
jgi:hypothetical protein